MGFWYLKVRGKLPKSIGESWWICVDHQFQLLFQGNPKGFNFSILRHSHVVRNKLTTLPGHGRLWPNPRLSSGMARWECSRWLNSSLANQHQFGCESGEKWEFGPISGNTDRESMGIWWINGHTCGIGLRVRISSSIQVVLDCHLRHQEADGCSCGGDWQGCHHRDWRWWHRHCLQEVWHWGQGNLEAQVAELYVSKLDQESSFAYQYISALDFGWSSRTSLVYILAIETLQPCLLLVNGYTNWYLVANFSKSAWLPCHFALTTMVTPSTEFTVQKSSTQRISIATYGTYKICVL